MQGDREGWMEGGRERREREICLWGGGSTCDFFSSHAATFVNAVHGGVRNGCVRDIRKGCTVLEAANDTRNVRRASQVRR
jgi:hypothetical protein